MATKQELMEEAYNRGILPPEKAAMYEEAKKRGLVAGPISETAISTISPEQKSEDIRSERVERSSKRFDKSVGAINRSLDDGLMVGALRAPQTAFNVAGQIAGDINDRVATGVTAVASAVIPEQVQDWTKEKVVDFLQTDIGGKALSAMRKGGKFWNDFSAEYPDEAMTVEAVFNLGGLGVLKKGSASVQKEIKNIYKDIRVLNSTGKHIDDKILSEVKKRIPKAIRPGVKGKGTYKMGEKYFEDAADGIKTIINNKNNIKLTDEFGEITTGVVPESLEQYSSAVSQAKGIIYKQYDDMAKAAGGTIDLTDIADELRKMAGTVEMQMPASRSAMSAIADNLEFITAKGSVTAQEAQAMLKVLNNRLNAYYAKATPDTYMTSTVEAVIANNLRKKLDNAITETVGPGYQGLKKQYGALKAVEADLNRRMVVEMRKDMKGLIDFSDIFSGAQAVNAIATKNLPLLMSATAAKGIASYYRKLRDPNEVVKKMFRSVDELVEQQKKFTPKSTLFKSAKEAKDSLAELEKAKQYDPGNPVEYNGPYYGPEEELLSR